MDLIYRDDGTVALRGPHSADPALTGTRGHRRFYAGMDLGQARDPAAIAIIKDEQLPLLDYDRGGRQLLGERRLSVVHLARFEGRSYVDLARVAAALPHRPPLTPRTSELFVDATGPGRPFVDVLHEMGVAHTGVQMTSGQGWSKGDRGLLNVSKSHLFYGLSGHLETGRLRVAKDAPLADALLAELSAFEVTVTNAGNLTVDVKGADHHGDLAVACALALFGAVSVVRGVFEVGKLENYW